MDLYLQRGSTVIVTPPKDESFILKLEKINK